MLDLIAASPVFIGLLSAAIAMTGILISLTIAIFGDDIRALLRRPKLLLSLPDLHGEWTVLSNGTPAIYFHGLVENSTPYRVAHGVELFVSECVVTRLGHAPEKQPLPCPLPVQARRKFNKVRHNQVDIGAVRYAYDLFCLLSTKELSLLLNCDRPNNFKSSLTSSGTIEIEIQALGINASSNKVFLKIEWDGSFPLESYGLEPHLRLTYKTT